MEELAEALKAIEQFLAKIDSRLDELEERLSDLENIVNTDSALVDELAYKAGIA